MKTCVICDSPLKSKVYFSMYCGDCRTAISVITNRVRRAMTAAKLQPAEGHDCVDCGKPAKELDHRFYSLPLEVEPVCVTCNQRRGPARDIVELVRIERGMIEWQDEAHMVAPGKASQPSALPQILADSERRFILQALDRHHWNATKAAESLGITFRQIRHRMQKLGIRRS